MLSDLIKLYNSDYMDPDASPRSLQRKVMFDIRYYFCRRARENIAIMTKSTFKLHFDVDTQIPFVKKVQDELTKNHKEGDEEIVSGFMAQILDTNGQPHRHCPIRSFENYIATLSPENNILWQQPKRCRPPPGIQEWYKPVLLGHNNIDNFMSMISSECDLSKRYTNHCIRVTGSNKLTRGKFIPKQIMSVTGHKSLESLAIYQRVQDDEKLMMGMYLTFNLFHPEQAKEIRDAQKVKIEEGTRENPPRLMDNIIPQLEIGNAPTNSNALVPVTKPTVSSAVTTPQIQIPNVPEAHALDPTIPKLLSLDDAIVPYEPPAKIVKVQDPQDTVDFDIMEMLSEFQNDNDENEMVLAATQCEKQLETQATMKSKTTAILKKSSPKLPLQQTFQNCTFGTIGTLNIHIHKH